jgi:serine kinase of HPr protein (carbohydrate metabolism regulator)
MSVPRNIHATCVATDAGGVLLLGPSGCGKSDLALRLIDRGAKLVSDDQVVVRREDGRLIASTTGALFGKLEVRGVGICDVPAQRETVVTLIVQLGDEGERLPEASTETLEGISLPLLRLAPHRASAPIKIELALSQGVGTT